MEQYRSAILREILFRLIPSILIVILGVIATIIMIKYIDKTIGGLWELKSARIVIFSAALVTLPICGFIMFFDTKPLFSDLNNNNFIEYYGEATFSERESNKEFNCYRLNDEEETLVVSNVGKAKASIDKCIVRVVYGADSKFVVVFEVEEVLEERPPINFP